MPSAAYRPRKPKETVLYRLVREHLDDFLQLVRDTYRAPLPKYVEDAFTHFLACGDVAHGFVRCHCDACRHDVLIAFSCKHRDICPSCSTRRMANFGAHLVDRILPNVPIRQWVLSIPFELRALCALRPAVLTAIGRIFNEEVARRYKSHTSGGRVGAVIMHQRFGGSLNGNTHWHALWLDGAFVKQDNGALGFIDAPPPERDEIEAVVRRIHTRALRWLARHGHLGESKGDEATALEACTQIALSGGTFLAPADKPKAFDREVERPDRRWAANFEHFDVHCAVRIDRDDDEGRERLVRYCTRPVLSLERLTVLKDGRVSYRVKYPRHGRTHRVMTGPEFLARLAALVAPPRHPLVRYFGILAPGAKDRRRVVPRPPACKKVCRKAKAEESTEQRVPLSLAVVTQAKPTNGRSDRPSTAEVRSAVRLDASVITVRHWERLAEGALYAATSRIEWATLLRRTFGFDALLCPRCQGRLRVLATIVDTDVAGRIAAHLQKAVARGPPSALDVQLHE